MLARVAWQMNGVALVGENSYVHTVFMLQNRRLTLRRVVCAAAPFPLSPAGSSDGLPEQRHQRSHSTGGSAEKKKSNLSVASPTPSLRRFSVADVLAMNDKQPMKGPLVSVSPGPDKPESPNDGRNSPPEHADGRDSPSRGYVTCTSWSSLDHDRSIGQAAGQDGAQAPPCSHDARSFLRGKGVKLLVSHRCPS